MLKRVEEDEIICKCMQVSESTIRSCIEKNDFTAIEDVTTACEAGGGCHTCHILIQLFIDQQQEKCSLPNKKEASEKGAVGSFFSKVFSKK